MDQANSVAGPTPPLAFPQRNNRHHRNIGHLTPQFRVDWFLICLIFVEMVRRFCFSPRWRECIQYLSCAFNTFPNTFPPPNPNLYSMVLLPPNSPNIFCPEGAENFETGSQNGAKNDIPG